MVWEVDDEEGVSYGPISGERERYLEQVEEMSKRIHLLNEAGQKISFGGKNFSFSFKEKTNCYPIEQGEIYEYMPERSYPEIVYISDFRHVLKSIFGESWDKTKGGTLMFEIFGYHAYRFADDPIDYPWIRFDDMAERFQKIYGRKLNKFLTSQR